MSTILKADAGPGDFLCVPVAGPVGSLIEIGQFLAGTKYQPYEHAEVYIGQPDVYAPWGYTVSAYPNRKGRLPLPKPPEFVPGAIWSSGLIDLTDEQRLAIVNWCTAHEHVKYSEYDYLALVAHRLHLPLPGLKEYIARPDSLICSQFVDMSYLQAGVELFSDGRWPGYVKPMDLAELLESKMARGLV